MYVENNIFGFFINSNFNEKENLKELFPYSDKNVYFNYFLLMIIQLLFLAKSVIGFPMEKKPVLTKMNFLSSIDASINFIKDISFFYVQNSFMYLTNLNLK